MSLAAAIAQHIHIAYRDIAVERDAIRLPVDIPLIGSHWPFASHDDIVRGYVIAYELMVADLKEEIQHRRREGGSASSPGGHVSG